MTDFNVDIQPFSLETRLDVIPDPVIERAQPWWNRTYPYRRATKLIATPQGLEKNHTVTTLVPRSIYAQNKVLLTLADLEVAYLISEVPEQWVVLARTVETLPFYYKVSFNLVEALLSNEITTRYYIYYGNLALLNQPTRGGYISGEWPLFVLPSSPEISYTQSGNLWRDGYSETRYAKAYFGFYGPQVRFYAAIGPNYGIAEVQIDSGNWIPVDLYNALELPSRIVYTHSGLSEGRHELRIRVSGNKNPNSNGTGVRLTGIGYRKHSIAEDVREEQYATFMWGGGMGGS